MTRCEVQGNQPLQTAKGEGYDQTLSRHVLALLGGEWRGEGEGGYPTIDSFVYREAMTFELRNEHMLYYKQQTEERTAGQAMTAAQLNRHLQAALRRVR